MFPLFCIEDYFTDEIIDVAKTFDEALAICKAHEGTIITPIDSDEVLFENVDLPF